MQKLAEFITRIPKAELHLHIEGSLEPAQMFMLSKRNSVSIPFATVEEIRSAYQFNNLQEFLDIYYEGMRVLQTEEDFYDLTYAYLEKSHKDSVKHTEIFFDPQAHTSRGLPISVPVNGIVKALEDGQKKLSVSSKLIMCFLRHLDEQSAFETLNQATPYLEHISGVGLDSSELGHPPAKFERVFQQARSLGLRCVAHAGEEGPAEYVQEAINLLKVDRIDHGNRAMDDPVLLKTLAEKKLALTLCPLSNVKLKVIEQLANHPVRFMLDQGITATINSDDPAYFGGYINQNFLSVAQALGLEQQHIIALAKNSFTGSFLHTAEKNKYLDAIDQFVATF